MQFKDDNKISILAVDDDDSILLLIEDVFEKVENYTLVTERDSEKALEILQTRQFDIIITDLMMPKHNGIDILRRAKEYKPDTIVIIITGFASLRTTLEAIKYGVHDYITKPFQIDELTLVINNAAEKINLQRERAFLQEQVKQMEGTIENLLFENEECKQKIESLMNEIENNRKFLDLAFKQKNTPDQFSLERIVEMGLKRQREKVG